MQSNQKTLTNGFHLFYLIVPGNTALHLSVMLGRKGNQWLKERMNKHLCWQKCGSIWISIFASNKQLSDTRPNIMLYPQLTHRCCVPHSAPPALISFSSLAFRLYVGFFCSSTAVGRLAVAYKSKYSHIFVCYVFGTNTNRWKMLSIEIVQLEPMCRVQT